MPPLCALILAAGLLAAAVDSRAQAPAGTPAPVPAATPAASPPPAAPGTPAPPAPPPPATAATPAPKPAATPVPPAAAAPTPKPASPAPPAVKPAPAPAPAAAATPARPAAPPARTTPAAKPPVPPPPKLEDVLAGKYKTADELWAHFQALERGPRGQGTTPEERARAFQEFVVDLRTTADLFAKKYPSDPRRWEARLTADRLTQRVGNGKSQAEIEKLYRETAKAADAPQEIKARARLGLIQMHREALRDDLPKERVLAVESEITAFAHDFPRHDALAELLIARAALWEKRDRAKAMTLLEELTAHELPAVAREATAQLRFRRIQNEPLALTFTALDGTEVDLARLRGKVVLIYFWQSGGGPVATETAAIVAAYEKLRDKGFEVLGIALDGNKDRALAFMQEKKMSWPTFFDGKGYRGAVAGPWAVRSAPTLWLVNKKGFVAVTDARGEVEDWVTRLLAEE